MMYQPVPGSDCAGHSTQTDIQDLNKVNQLKYLGSTVANDNKMDDEIISRMLYYYLN